MKEGYYLHMETNTKKPGGLILIAAGLLLIADSLFIFTRASLNLGTVMPLMLGVPLLVLGFIRPHIKKHRILRAGAFVLSVLYLLFGSVFMITTGLILFNSTEPDDGADVLIVLGSGIRGNTPTLTMKYRLDAALDYIGRNPETYVIVSGGKGHDEQLSEAEVMKNYLLAHGVDAERVIMEDASASTEENFIFSKRIIDERFGPDARIVFSTTRFHVFRSERVAKKLGINAEGIPAKGVWYLAPNDYLRECVVIAAYFITGKI